MTMFLCAYICVCVRYAPQNESVTLGGSESNPPKITWSTSWIERMVKEIGLYIDTGFILRHSMKA